MTIRSYSRWLMVPLLLLSLQLTRAQTAPSGTYDFGPVTNSSIWDLTGDYGVGLIVNEGSSQETEIGIAFHIDQNIRGRLSGTGVTIVQIGNDLVAGEYRVSGNVRSPDSFDFFTTIIIRVSGEGFIGGRFTSYRMTILVPNAVIDPATSLIEGNARVILHVAGMDDLRGNADFVVETPGNMDGTWTLTLNIVPLNKLAGTGVITLANGRTLTLNLKGVYVPEVGSFLKLTGSGETRGSRLKVFLSDAQDEVSVETGTVMGQRVHF